MMDVEEMRDDLRFLYSNRERLQTKKIRATKEMKEASKDLVKTERLIQSLSQKVTESIHNTNRSEINGE